MNKEKVLKLAKLARIELKDEEASELTQEFGSILNYVGEVKRVGADKNSFVKNKEDFNLHNVLREDKEPHEAGLYTEEFLEQAPTKDNSYIKVKKIL